MRGEHEFLEEEEEGKESFYKSLRFWVLFLYIALIATLALFSYLSGEQIDSEWIGSVVAVVSSAFILGRSYRPGASIIIVSVLLM